MYLGVLMMYLHSFCLCTNHRYLLAASYRICHSNFYTYDTRT